MSRFASAPRAMSWGAGLGVPAGARQRGIQQGACTKVSCPALHAAWTGSVRQLFTFHMSHVAYILAKEDTRTAMR